MSIKDLFCFFAIFIVIFNGRDAGASWPWSKKYIAKVNGEIITIDEFQKKLDRAHTVKDIGSKMNTNLPTVNYRNILDDLVNEKLMMQEALGIGLKEKPEYIQNYNLTKLNLSLDLLRKEEVIDKVTVSDKEIYDQFIFRNESVKIRHLFTKNKEKGERLLKALKEGANFVDLVKKESEDPEELKKKGGDVGFKKRGRFAKEIGAAAFSLKEGETSGLIKTKKGFHIIKLEEKKIPEKEISKRERRIIERSIFRKKEKKRNQEYLDTIRKKAEININEKNIKLLDPEDVFAGEEIIVATVNGKPITGNKILIEIKSGAGTGNREDLNKLKEEVLNRIMRDMLLEMETRKKNYDHDASFQKQLSKRMDFFLLKLFKNTIIGGIVKLDKTEIKKYYRDNKKEFFAPDKLKLKIIKLSNIGTANKVLEELKKGADFGVMAREMSKDPTALDKGNVGWIEVIQLAPHIRKKVDEMEIREVYGPFDVVGGFLLLKVEGKEKGELKDFTVVRGQIVKTLSKEKYFGSYENYVRKLRSVSKIEVNEPVFNDFLELKTRKKAASPIKKRLAH